MYVNSDKCTVWQCGSVMQMCCLLCIILSRDESAAWFSELHLECHWCPWPRCHWQRLQMPSQGTACFSLPCLTFVYLFCLLFSPLNEHTVTSSIVSQNSGLSLITSVVATLRRPGILPRSRRSAPQSRSWLGRPRAHTCPALRLYQLRQM